MTNTIIAKVQNIIAHSTDVYNYEVKTNDWVNYGKDRTYITVVETADRTKHFKKYDFGYIDNVAGEYVPGKWNAEQNFNLSGSKF